MELRWLSVEEIAIHLGVSRDTVYRWICDAGLPAHKIGKLWKFDRDEVDKWVRTKAPGTSPSRSKRLKPAKSKLESGQTRSRS